MDMQFLPDTPLIIQSKLERGTVDALGFAPFASQLASAIHSSQPPFVFGVLGDWGTGKTSILRLLEFELKETPICVPIWFNAWRYENETNILFPLLQTIREAHDKIVSSTGERFASAFLDTVMTSAFVLGDLGLRGLTKALWGEAVKLEEIRDRLKEVQEKKQPFADVLIGWKNQVDDLHKAFGAMLDAFAHDYAQAIGVQAEQIRFVILIDDLDRCLPDTTIRLLESIKNHLEVDHAVFVLALNAAIVYQGIRHKYGNADVSGRAYLEKILNYTFYVPEPDRKLLEGFARSRLEQITSKADHKRLEEAFNAFSRALSQCHFSNPRKIKRILNRYLMFLARQEAELAQFRLPSISRLLMLAEYFPEVFQILRDYLESQEANHQRTFEAKNFVDYYQVQLKQSLFSQYPQLAIMRDLLTLVEATNLQDYRLARHAAEIYQLTRLI